MTGFFFGALGPVDEILAGAGEGVADRLDNIEQMIGRLLPGGGSGGGGQ